MALFATLALVLLGTQPEATPGDLWLEAKAQGVQRQRSELVRVARAALPAVVSITALEATRERDGTSELPSLPQRALGSGFFIHPNGYILTSFHVIEDGHEIRVSTLSEDGPRAYPARVVGKDEVTDIALLKVDSVRKFPVLPLGSTDSVEVADWVVAIGNPYGMSHSVTVGVVSYKSRGGIAPNGKEGIFDYLQTDASINPGNSGGPLLDLDGNVIAIASAVNVSAQGIGFAVPIEIAKAVLPQLSSNGMVRRSWMGISVRDRSESAELESPEGVVVEEVLNGGPASEAGLEVGDVIVRVGTTQIRRTEALRWKIAMGEVGKLLDLTVRREGKPMRLKVRLAETPQELDDPIEAKATAGCGEPKPCEPAVEESLSH